MCMEDRLPKTITTLQRENSSISVYSKDNPDLISNSQ